MHRSLGGGGYWLAGWISVYRHLLAQPEQVSRRQIFLDYDTLCRDPAGARDMIRSMAGVTIDVSALRRPSARPVDGVGSERVGAARELHQALIARSGLANKHG